MSCCCNKILDLCQVSVCEDSEIKTGYMAATAGVHKLSLDYLGIEVSIEADIAEGEEVVFPTTGLNEDYKYTGKIIGPDDEPIVITVDEVEYNCISFQTRLSFLLNE